MPDDIQCRSEKRIHRYRNSSAADATTRQANVQFDKEATCSIAQQACGKMQCDRISKSNTYAREVRRIIVLGSRVREWLGAATTVLLRLLRTSAVPLGGSFFMTVRYADAATSRAACACAHRTRRVRATFRCDFLREANIACGLTRLRSADDTIPNSCLLLLPPVLFFIRTCGLAPLSLAYNRLSIAARPTRRASRDGSRPLPSSSRVALPRGEASIMIIVQED